jgi:hypothetical protein
MPERWKAFCLIALQPERPERLTNLEHPEFRQKPTSSLQTDVSRPDLLPESGRGAGRLHLG